MFAKILEVLSRQSWTTFRPTGPKCVDDASLRGSVAECGAAGCDVLLVVQPTISDGRLAPTLAQIWDGPVVLWATPEKQTGSMISSNSLVGTHLFAATMAQLGRPFELVYGNLDWDLAERQLQRGVHVAFAARAIRKAKLCLVGAHAPGFVDLHPHPDLLNKTFGCQLLQVNLMEFFDSLAASADAVVEEDVAKVAALSFPKEEGVDAEQLHDASRIYLALRHTLEVRARLSEARMGMPADCFLVQDSGSDAVAIRCWPELPSKFGHWPYSALTRLATEGLPTACEGDTDGALGGLVAKLLGLGCTYLSDWLEHDRDTITLWHGGFCPLQLNLSVGEEGGPCHALHFNNGKPGVVNSTIKPGMAVTVFRFWVCGGEYKLTVLQGTTEKPARHLLGNNGLLRVDDCDVVDYFERMLHEGMPHHLCLVEGHHKDRLLAFARSVGVKVVA